MATPEVILANQSQLLNQIAVLSAELAILKARVEDLEQYEGEPWQINSGGEGAPNQSFILSLVYDEEEDETVAKISSGFRATDTSDWEEVWEEKYPFTAGAVAWMQRIYPTKDNPAGSWEQGLGTPPPQDETCRVIRFGRIESDGAGGYKVVLEEPGNVFVVDIRKCDEDEGEE